MFLQSKAASLGISSPGRNRKQVFVDGGPLTVIQP